MIGAFTAGNKTLTVQFQQKENVFQQDCPLPLLWSATRQKGGVTGWFKMSPGVSNQSSCSRLTVHHCPPTGVHWRTWHHQFWHLFNSSRLSNMILLFCFPFISFICSTCFHSWEYVFGELLNEHMFVPFSAISISTWICCLTPMNFCKNTPSLKFTLLCLLLLGIYPPTQRPPTKA